MEKEIAAAAKLFHGYARLPVEQFKQAAFQAVQAASGDAPNLGIVWIRSVGVVVKLGCDHEATEGQRVHVEGADLDVRMPVNDPLDVRDAENKALDATVHILPQAFHIGVQTDGGHAGRVKTGLAT